MGDRNFQGVWETEGLPRAALTWASVREMKSRPSDSKSDQKGSGGWGGVKMRRTEGGVGLGWPHETPESSGGRVP